MSQPDVSEFLSRIVAWATRRPDVRGLVLVGSRARGDARTDSDVDIVMLVDEKGPYLKDLGWLKAFGPVTSVSREEWGVVTSLRVFLSEGYELEISLAKTSWAATNPIDPGTNRVVSDGVRVLYDPHLLLEGLLNGL